MNQNNLSTDELIKLATAKIAYDLKHRENVKAYQARRKQEGFVRVSFQVPKAHLSEFRHVVEKSVLPNFLG